MLEFLNRPYPTVTSPQKRLIIIFGIGLFIFLFLFIFQPFGLENYKGPDKIIILTGYGIISILSCMVTMLLLPLVFPNWFRDEVWKTWKEIAMTALTFLLIGTFNLFYSTALGFFSLSVAGFFYFQLITLAVGLLPTGLFVMIKENQLLRQNLRRAMEMTHAIETHKSERVPSVPAEPIIISSENGKEQVRLEPSQILFIAAAENYVEIYWLEKELLQKTLLRRTLSRVEELLKDYPAFFRCHRAYIVNLQNIRSVEGNAQGYRVRFSQTDKQVPVSRTQINEFQRRMRS